MQIVLKDSASKTVIGKLSFIDLAGSERGADRGETDVKTRYIIFTAMPKKANAGISTLMYGPVSPL
jgi:hypothetical protein